MNIPAQFSDQLSLAEQVVYVLNVLRKASADEVAMEIMELKGIAAEDGVADLTMDTQKQLDKLCEANLVQVVKEKREKRRYALVA
jgi:hypothetical protein